MRFAQVAALRGVALAALATVAGVATAQQQAQPGAVRPKAGLVITRSTRVAPGHYRLAANASLDSALITVRGDDITVDFTGVTLEGQSPLADPDLAAGVAIRVEGGRNVRIVNAHVSGYRVAVLAKGTRGLTLAGNDVSHNWKPRLFSLVEHESLVDWLSFHHNERGEWLRFGAAIYLDDVRGGELRNNTAEQGMNGLLLVRSDSMRIHDNTFSFNSGLGVGLYRSSGNTITRNRIEYDVRGYSHEFYRRGQDSAGLLLYEQSSGNTVAFNAVSHGGDGLFLWAGQSTMDTGDGGANDNLFLSNDFSFAPTNAMEATFSRNDFIGNHANGSDYGLWGGYSYDSRIVGNCFVRNRVGVAIEHGQANVLSANHFIGDSVGIRLWADSIEPSEWGYPRHRDTRSRDYRVAGNTFAGVAERMRAANTSGLDTAGNSTGQAAGFAERCRPRVPPEFMPQVLALGGTNAEFPASAVSARDRSAIVVDEWGPYDWRSPRLWPLDSTRATPLRLSVLGPPGAWRVAGRRGVAALSRVSGHTGDTLVVSPVPDSFGHWQLDLEYVGAATVTPRGERRPAGAPYRFSFGRFEPRADWTVRFFAWTEATDPRKNPGAFAALLDAAPLLERHEPRLDYLWYRPTVKGVPLANFAIEATTMVTLPAGVFTLRSISDDAVRVWVDGRLVIDHWAPHESAVDFARLGGGRHDLRVVHFQVDGWTELRLDVVRGIQRSAGSAGPH